MTGMTTTRAASHGAAGCREILGALARAGVRARITRDAPFAATSGLPLVVPVRRTLACPVAAERLVRRIAAAGGSAMLALLDLGAGDEAIRSLDEFCLRLREGLAAAGVSRPAVATCLPAGVMPLKAFLVITTAVLGDAPRYALFDGADARRYSEARQLDVREDLAFLWRRHARSPGLLPVYAASVTTNCPLLGDERASTLTPGGGIQVPPGTAWLPLDLDVASFADGRGCLDWPRLERALATCVSAGDRLLDGLAWPDPQQRRDALLNRRLAVTLRGLGRLVVLRGTSPSELATLRRLDATIHRIATRLHAASRELAERRGPLPALLQADPSLRSPAGPRQRDWRLRWRQALRASAVRHRNLLVMSPSSVLPGNGEDAIEFADLLPVLKHADAFAFEWEGLSRFRNLSDFSAFHCRAFAVMQQRNAAALVAAGV